MRRPYVSANAIAHEPSKVVQQFFVMLPPRYPVAGKRALDVSSGTGKNAFALARRGFLVGAVNSNPEALDRSRRAQVAQRISHEQLLLRHDIVKLTEELKISAVESFDVVLSAEAMFGIKKDVRKKSVAAVQSRTAIGGYNLVSGFMWNNALLPEDAKYENFLTPTELEEYYSSESWVIDRYDPSTAMMPSGDSVVEVPHVMIIAHRAN